MFGKVSDCCIAMGLVALLGGCQSFEGPKERSKIMTELDAVYPPLDEKGLKALVDKYREGGDPGTLKPLRNRILFEHIRKIKNYHEAVETDLFETSAYVGFYLDIGTLIATTLAAAVTPASTKTFWAVVGSITGGTRLAASKNFLDERNRSIVLASMRKLRAEKLTAIFSRMHKEDTTTYPLEEGVMELIDFLNAGSVAGSLADLSETAETQKKEAEENLEQEVKKAMPNPPPK